MEKGDVVGDRFEIERAAGSGGMGTVYRARDRRTGAFVALKVVAPGKESVRFEREADALAELVHPGIVRYVARGTTDRGMFLAMEWLEGEDLEQRLAREGLSVLESVTLAENAALALAAAHARGIVHRDVKPSNLFLVGGDVAKVKLLDFGVARLGARMTRTGLMVGTPGYVSPEQARGQATLDGRADVFALGCVLFECLTGRPAWIGEHAVALLTRILLEDAPAPSSVRADVPVWLDDVVLAMLQKDPNERPDANAVAIELAELRDRAQEGARITMRPPPERKSLTTGEHRVVSLVLVAVDAPILGDALAKTAVDLPPASWVDAFRDAAREHGARLDVLANGSLVASIRASGVATDLAARAARCALAFRGLAPDVPIALATGRSALGEIGELAMRALRMATASSGVIIDDVTAGLLGARFDIRGGTGGLELIGAREHVDRAPTLLGKPSPCVGREREIGTLLAIFEECVEEPVAGCVLVTGPAGIGKSRVHAELVRRLAGRDVVVWVASADTVSRGSPFGMVAPPIRAEAGLREGDALEVRRRKVLARVARHVPAVDRMRVAAFLGELVGTPFLEEDVPELAAARVDGIVMGDQIRRAWQDFLDAETRVHPVLFVLEDLHWGDVPSVKLVDLALRNLRERPLMVLALARPEVSELFPDLWRARGLQQIRLDELTRRASEKLVRTFLGSIDDAKVTAMVDRAAGNAFYLEEIVRAEAEGKGNSTPGTVIAMVQSRLEGFDPSLRRVIRAASVFGQIFWSGAVHALLGGHDTFDGRVLHELEDREVAVRIGEGRFPDEWRFRHAVVRDAAYAMLTDADRQLGHRLAAEWLESAGETDPVILAEHWEQGGENARAARCWMRAAQQALEGNDFRAVIENAERGERCGAANEELGVILAHRAEAHRWRGEIEQSAVMAKRALDDLVPESDVWFTALSSLTEANSSMGKTDQVRMVAEVLLSKGPPRTRVQAEAYSRVAGQASAAGEYTTAKALCSATIEALKTGVLGADNGWVHRAYAVLHAIDGNIAGTARMQRASAEAFERAGQKRYAATQRLNQGDSLKEIGDYAAAEATLRAVIVEAGQMGMNVIERYAKHNLSMVLARTGRIAEGLALAREAAEEADRSVHLRGASFAWNYVALMHLMAGRARESLEASRRALASAAPPVRPLVEAVMARAHLALGENSEALELTTRGMKTLETLGALDEGEAILRLAHAEALHANGDDAAALSAVLSAKERLLDRASNFDDHFRKTFLENVSEHARTLALATEWSQGK